MYRITNRKSSGAPSSSIVALPTRSGKSQSKQGPNCFTGWHGNLVEVGYLALIWYDWPEALAIDHRDELPQSAFECFNHALEAGVAVAVADLSPVVQETVTLHLEQLGLFPVDKVDPVHVGSRHDLKIDIWNRESSGGSKNLIHRREIRMLLDDGKLALELSCQTNPRWGAITPR